MLGLVVLVALVETTCLLPTAVEATKQVQLVQTVLPYHQVMTPKWIEKNALITGPHALYSKYFEIALTTGAAWKRALQIPLVAPNILTSNDSVTVTVTVALDTVLADKNDHDPIFGISDGTSFIGIQAHDRSNYPSESPCIEVEASSVQNILTNRRRGTGPLVASRHYSSEIKIQINPAEHWGSCHTEHDEGYVNILNYQISLDLTKALYFEVYRDDDPERYRVKYIMVDVNLE